MTREKLVTASKTLEQAATGAHERHRQRIEEQSDQIMQLAERDQDPDHGRLDRHMNVLRELHDETDNPDVERAYERIREYRRSVSGV